MKKIVSFLTLLLIAFSFNITAQHDLAIKHVGVTSPEPTNGNEFDTDQIIKSVKFTFKNVGNTTYGTGSLVPVDLIVDGTKQGWTYRLFSDLVPGDSMNYTLVTSTANPLVDFPSTAGNFDVCVKLKITTDTNSLNDENCNTYNMIPSTVPKVFSFTPEKGPCMTVVTINGENFNTTPSKNIVRLRHVECKVLTASATKLTVEVPTDGYIGKISVTVNVDGIDKQGDSEDFFQYEGCTTGVNQFSSSDYSVYYSNDVVNVSLGNADLSSSKNMQIVNYAGQVVVSELLSFDGGLEEINVSNLPSGAYIVNIEGSTFKFVK